MRGMLKVCLMASVICVANYSQAKIVNGTDGNDTLIGTNQADVLNGKNGDDVLKGGKGPDTYIYSPNNGSDTIEEVFELDSEGYAVQNTFKCDGAKLKEIRLFGTVKNNWVTALGHTYVYQSVEADKVHLITKAGKTIRIEVKKDASAANVTEKAFHSDDQGSTVFEGVVKLSNCGWPYSSLIFHNGDSPSERYGKIIVY